MIAAEYGEGVFESFVRTGCTLREPDIVNPSHLQRCAKITIRVQNTGFSKRMFWCTSRRFRKQSGNFGEMEGFFCAGAPLYTMRAYAFRPPQRDSNFVIPEGEINNVNLFGDD